MSSSTIEIIQELLEDKYDDIKRFLIGAIECDDEKNAEDWFFEYKQTRNAMKELEEYRAQKQKENK